MSPSEYPCTCGKGWTCIEPGVTWPEKCGRCLGAKKLTIGRIAKIIGEDRRALRRVHDGRAGLLVGGRVVPKLVAFFPEAFAP